MPHAIHREPSHEVDRSVPSHGRATATDPVCGMEVEPHQAKYRHAFDDQTYYFCSGRCLKAFASTPAKYLKVEQPTVHADTLAGAIYTCPMHPEIRQEGAGTCPICGRRWSRKP